MSATFDATTTAEYAAASTAAARSALIVAALTGTISVKVFDGSNVEKGSGTMDAPWATASGNTVTIGEVTSFTVGATATPDANWYIRFQNAGATRWLRASFNLTGADFTWSLDNWTATHTGTIGTATITTSGNAAPVFTVEPTSASIAATGGTIQFTATDADSPSLIYTLTTTRFGITINSSTGLVTVTGDAAGTSGNIVVQVSDGTLTDTATCMVTVYSNVEQPTLTQYGGSTYDVVSYAMLANNGWRTVDDVVPGWDWSFPTQSPPDLSGMWQFSNNISNWPSNFPGNRLWKINADWNAMEPTEGNYTFTTTFDLLGSLPSTWAGVQVDVRGCVYSFPTDTSQVTAPTWLAGRGIPTYNSGDFQYYDISNTGYYTPFRLLISEIAAYVPAGGSVTVGEHPRMMGLIMHGSSNSEGEESFLGSTPANTVNTALHWVSEFGDNARALCWIGEGRSYRDEVEPIVVGGGVGSRGGLLERFLRNSFTPYEIDNDLDGDPITGAFTRTGQLAEQYYNSSGVAQSDNFYLTVDETYPIIANIRYYQDQMEEFGASYIGVAAKGWTDNLSLWQHIYRMCMLRGLQMRRNSLAVEFKNTSLMDSDGYAGASGAVNGAEGFVNPALMKYGSVQLGRRVYNATEDASFEANEAFCLLCRMRARSYNPLTLGEGFGTNSIHNLERWLTQREVDGAATTPYITRDMGYNPSGDDSALVSNPTAATMEMSRKGTNIALRLDNRMRFGSSVAIKITYYDDNAETVTLRYTNTSSGTTDVSWVNTGSVVPVVRTRTYFLSNFSNTDAVNLRLLCSVGNTGFMLVRVIKT